MGRDRCQRSCMSLPVQSVYLRKEEVSFWDSYYRNGRLKITYRLRRTLQFTPVANIRVKCVSFFHSPDWKLKLNSKILDEFQTNECN